MYMMVTINTAMTMILETTIHVIQTLKKFALIMIMKNVPETAPMINFRSKR